MDCYVFLGHDSSYLNEPINTPNEAIRISKEGVLKLPPLVLRTRNLVSYVDDVWKRIKTCLGTLTLNAHALT